VLFKVVNSPILVFKTRWLTIELRGVVNSIDGSKLLSTCAADFLFMHTLKTADT